MTTTGKRKCAIGSKRSHVPCATVNVIYNQEEDNYTNEYNKHKQAQETIRDMLLTFVDTSHIQHIYNDFILFPIIKINF